MGIAQRDVLDPCLARTRRYVSFKRVVLLKNGLTVGLSRRQTAGSEARAFFFCLAARHSAHPHATRSHTRSRRRARSRVSRDPRPTPALYPSVAPSFLSASQSYLPEPENPRPHPQRVVIVWLPSTFSFSYAGFPSPPASLEGSGLEEGVPVVLSELPGSAASFAPSCCTATEARAALRNFSVRVLS